MNVTMLLQILAIAALFPVTFLVFTTETPRGLRYQLWKRGLVPFHSNYLKLLNVDTGRDGVVRGKDRAQLAKRFPLRERGEGNASQRSYDEKLNEEYAWVGESQWIVVLKDGIGVRLQLVKG